MPQQVVLKPGDSFTIVTKEQVLVCQVLSIRLRQQQQQQQQPQQPLSTTVMVESKEILHRG